MQKLIRPHWRIENSYHWVGHLFPGKHNQSGKRNALKGTTDRSTRKRPGSLTKKQLRAAHDESYLEEVLSLVQESPAATDPSTR